MIEEQKEGRSRLSTLDEELSRIASFGATTLVDKGKGVQDLFSHFQHFLVEKELQENLSAFKNKLERGINALIKGAEEHSRKDPSFPLKEAISCTCRLIVFLLRIPKHLDEYEKMLECNIPVKEACRIPDTIISSFFEIAVSYHKAGKWEDASDCFGILTFLDSSCEKFWIGFANAEYSCGRFDNAFFGYSVASYVNPFNPALYLFSCRSLEALSNFQNVFNAMNLTFSIDSEDPEWQLLKKVMKVAKERLLYLVLESRERTGHS
jgi:hypothetical protein